MRAKLWLKLGFSVVVAAAIIYRVPAQELRLAFRGVSFGWLVAALGCVGCMLSARWYRWHQLLAAGGVHTLKQDSARSLIAGFTLSLVTPGRIGELGRCLFAEESDRPVVLLLNVLDRALDTWALLTCTVLSLMALRPRPYGVFALGVWLALLPVAMGLPTFVSHVARAGLWSKTLRAKLQKASRQTVQLRIPTFAAWALVSTSLDLLTFYCLLRAFHPVSMVTVLTSFPLIIMAGGLPISISGLGPREGAAAVLLTRYGVASAVAVDATLLLWIFSAVLPAMAGGVWLLVYGSPFPAFPWRPDDVPNLEKRPALSA